ncbi:MAG: GNAT family N-acetyltransferase [Nitrospinaceae bacterium]
MGQGKREASYSIEPLGRHHDRAAFSCGKEALDRYIKKQARQDAKRHYAAPFVLVEKGEKNILGYYTLSSFGIRLDELPGEIVKKFPPYPIVPATLLGRLAVDEGHHGKGLGELLLMDALHRSLDQADVIGSTAVVVEAMDKEAFEFYENFDFLPFPDRRDRLFLPMKTILKLF